MEDQFFVILLAIITSFSLILMVVFNTSPKPTSKLPPGPWKLPVIGNLHQLIGNSPPHRRLRDLANRYGPIIHLQLGQVPHIVISSPEFAKEVFKTHDSVFAQRPFLLAADILLYNSGDVAFSPYGDYWRQLRKLCVSQLLSAKRVQSFRSIREDEVLEFIKSISSGVGSPVNFSKMLHSLTNRITARATFGKLSNKDDHEFFRVLGQIVEALGGFTVADVFPSMKLLHAICGVNRKLQRLHKEIDVVLKDIVNEHRTKTVTNGAKFGNEGGDDLVDILLNIRESGNLELTITSDNIKAIILEMFLAGSEASFVAVSWALTEIVRNPRVLKKVQEEVRQVFHGKSRVDETGVNKLNYLNLVIKEALRLHPPGPLLLPREGLERVEINGYEILAGTKLFVNAWAMGRDPHYWKEPEKFYPERFLGSSVDYKGANFEFIPFGAGRRICPGMLYGVAIIEVALAALLYHFDLKLPEGVTGENLDMSETFGVASRKRIDLLLVPTIRCPVSVE